MAKRYTIHEINFIKEFYPIKGQRYCSDNLNISLSKVKAIAKKYDIKVPHEIRTYNKTLRRKNSMICNVNPDKFINVETKYHAYILGLLWADGTIRYKRKTISCCNIISDAVFFEQIFNITGKWNKRIRKYKNPNNQDTFTFFTTNYKLYDFLFNMDYWDKSFKSHQKIMEYIPNKFLHYWLRGLIDGDGCFCISMGSNGFFSKSFSVASTDKQNWNYIKTFFENNHIKISIRHKKSGSYIFSTNQTSFLNLNKLLYPEGWDNIGLKRKYDKLQKIINTYVKKKFIN